MGQNFSFVDCCAAPIRSKDKVMDMSVEEMEILLTSNQLGILVLVLMQFLLVLFWLGLSFVFGFALYDGSAGTAHPVSHLGWWLMIELAVLCAGFMSYRFRMAPSSGMTKLEYSILDARNYLVFYVGLLIVGGISHIIHITLSIIEAAGCSSSFCRGFNVVDPANAALLAMPASVSAISIVWIVILFLMLGLEVGLIIRSLIYRRHLATVLAADATGRVFTVTTGREGQNVPEKLESSFTVTPLLSTTLKQRR